MKGKFALLLLLMFMGVFLIGCEDMTTFTTTTAETPVTTTAPVTTAAPTTTQTGVTTAPATTVPVTTAPVTTAPVTTAPVTTAPVTTSTFDRGLLIEAIQEMDGSGEMSVSEAEFVIGQMKAMLGITDEEELYSLVLMVPEMMMGLMTIETLADFQAWYLDAKTEFSPEFLTTTLANVIRGLVDERAANPGSEWVLEEIAYLEEELLDAQADLAALVAQVTLYATTKTTDAAKCIAYFNALIAESETFGLAHNAANQYFYDADYKNEYLYYDLLNHLEDQYYYTYQYVNPIMYDDAVANFNSLWGTLPLEEQLIFAGLLEMYETYLNYHYVTVPAALELIIELVDSEFQPAYQQIQNFHMDYMDLLWWVGDYERDIANLEERLAQEEQMDAFMAALSVYLHTPSGFNTLNAVVVDLYGMLDAVIVNFDEDLFNMIMDIVTSEAFDPSALLEPETIVLLVGKLADILATMQTAMDEDAVVNLGNLFKAVATVYVESLDLPAVEKTAMLSVILPKIDEYLGILVDVYDEILSFLQSVDETKVNAVLDFIAFMNGEEEEEEEEPVVMMSMNMDYMVVVMVEASKLVQTLVGDGSLDLTLILNHLVTIYFDVEYRFDADPDHVALIRGLVIENFTTLLTMTAEIALIDPANVGFEDMMLIQEFAQRGQALSEVFRYGFEVAEEWEFGVSHEDILNFVVDMFGYYDMSEEDAEALLVELLNIFGMEDEEEFYFFMMGMAFHMSRLPYLDSLDDLMAWYDYFFTLGMTETDIADILVNMLHYMITLRASEDGYYQGQIDWYLEMIAEIEDHLLELEGNIDAIDDALLALLNGNPALTPTQRTQVITYWEANKVIADYEIRIERLRWQLMDDDNNIFDWYTYDGLFMMLDMVRDGSEPQGSFDVLWNALSPEEQALYQPMLSLKLAYFDYWENVYSPINDTVQGDMALAGIVNAYEFHNWLNWYWNFTQEIYSEQENISWHQRDIDYLLQQIAFAEAMALYLDDPVNRQMIIDLILIVFEEVDNLIANLENDTVAMLLALVMEELALEDVDLTPEAIVLYLDDLLPIIGNLLDSIDPTEQAMIKTLMIDILTIRMTAEGWDETEITNLTGMIASAYDKYFPRILEVRDILVSALDNLSAADIGVIMDLIFTMAESEEDPSQAAIMVAIATLVDILCYDYLAEPLLDFETLLDYFVEGYFDVTYQFDYLVTDMEALQDVVFAIATDMIDVAHTARAIDLDAVTADDLEILYYLYIYVGTLAQSEGFEALEHPAHLNPFDFDPADFYDHTAFVELLQRYLGGDIDPALVASEIARLGAYYGTDTELETFLYTFFLGYVWQELPM